MSLFRARRVVALAVTAGALVVASRDARASNPVCSTLPGSIIYGAGGSAQQPLIGEIATQLSALPSPYTVVYSDAGAACTGYGYLVSPPLTPVTGTAYYWTAAGVQSSCTLDGSETFTFAVMGNAPNLCTGTTGLAAGFGEFLGPVQPLDFVVPASSTQQAISTEAAYYIWGFFASDSDHTVAPWNTPSSILTRSTSSFVSLFLALDTGLPVARVAGTGGADGGNLGTLAGNNAATVQDLQALNNTTTAEEESGIGFVSGEVADGNRSVISILAYQHTGQTCGYWPDSTSKAFDKVNVRNGQYWLWSPVHLYAAVSGDGGTITDPNTAFLIGLLAGTQTAPTGVDVFAAEIGSYTVPRCAMQVWRDGDLAPPYSSAPAEPCSCKYDFATNNTNKPSTCKTCTQNSDCATQHCRNIGPVDEDAGASSDAGANVGYCEAY